MSLPKTSDKQVPLKNLRVEFPNKEPPIFKPRSISPARKYPNSQIRRKQSNDSLKENNFNKSSVNQNNANTNTKTKSLLPQNFKSPLKQKSELNIKHVHTQSNVTPRPLQLDTGYYDWKGDFIPAGVLKAPFSHKPFNINEKMGLDRFLKHLLDDFKLVIADLKKIADFTQYMHYWTERFNIARELLNENEISTNDLMIEETLSKFCTPIQTNPYNPKNIASIKKVTYYLLCDKLEEDKKLRESLQISRLEYILAQQELERQDNTFMGKCFFCKYRVTKGNRSDLILHMTQCHKFQIGHPDNIVFANEFISKIKVYFDDITCPFCVKKYKDKNTLLEHMKKKNHRRLDPRNTDFDKYYMINYLEPGKHWSELQEEIKMQEQMEHELKRAEKLKQKKIIEDDINNIDKSINSCLENSLNVNAAVFVPKMSAEHVQPKIDIKNETENEDSNSNKESTSPKKFESKKETESDNDVDTDNEEEWEEKPDYSNQCFKCLFSESYFQTYEECLIHMLNIYNFDLHSLAISGRYSFYDIMKIINFTRFSVSNNKMSLDEILVAISNRLWTDIKWMFPVFEDDQLLYSFESHNAYISSQGPCINYSEDQLIKDCVISEDQCDLNLIRSTSVLKDLVLND